MKGKLTWIVACVLALGLIAAGCGDSDDGNDDSTEGTGTSGATETLSKAEFIEQGNEICKQGDKEIQAAGESLGQGTSKEELDAFVTDELVPSVQGQIDDIRALGPPEEDADLINGILDDAEAELDKLDADPSLIEQNNLFDEVNQQLDAYGLTECADDEQ
jgi:hypothetical protein